MKTTAVTTEADLAAELEAHIFATRELGHRDTYVGQVADLEAMKQKHLQIIEKTEVVNDLAQKSVIAQLDKEIEQASAERTRLEQLCGEKFAAYQKGADEYSSVLAGKNAARDTERQLLERRGRLADTAAKPKAPLVAPGLVDLDIEYFARAIIEYRRLKRNSPDEYAERIIMLGHDEVPNNAAGAALERIHRDHPEKSDAIHRAQQGERPGWRP